MTNIYPNQSSLDDNSNGVSGVEPVIYISGEENVNQIIASRALRLGRQDPELLLWWETDADAIANERPFETFIHLNLCKIFYTPLLPYLGRPY